MPGENVNGEKRKVREESLHGELFLLGPWGRAGPDIYPYILVFHMIPKFSTFFERRT